jgi:hypothetical protein
MKPDFLGASSGVQYMVDMNIQCPACDHQVVVHGNPQQTIVVMCPQCNARGTFTFPSPAPSVVTPFKGETKRPIGVTILAVLAIIGAVMVIVDFGFMAGVSFVGSSSASSISPFLVLYLLLIIALVVALFLIAFGFWRGLRWSWYAAIILLIIGMIVLIYSVLSTFSMLSTISSLGGSDIFFVFTMVRSIITVILSGVVSGLLIFYLTRPTVKTYFHLGYISQ